jgi:transcriptional regulator with XRE-family HTH domain
VAGGMTAFAAHLEVSPKRGGQRREPRRMLRLEAPGALASGEATNVLVHNVSATGLLLESQVSLVKGDRIEIELPHAGATWSKIIWSSGAFYGCQFDTPISAAALSAAQLRGAGRHEVDIAAALPGEAFGVRLQRLRKERGLTQSRVAEKLGVSKPTVWAWEQGRSRPVDERIDALAEVLGVSRSQLLSGVNSSVLHDLLADARRQIADAVGTRPESVRIMVEL